MNASLAVLSHGIAPALASALLHAVWQCALLALAAACALAAMSRASAAARHAVAMGFMIAMALAPALRFALIWRSPDAGAMHAGPLAAHAFARETHTEWFSTSASFWSDTIAWLWLLGVALMLARHAGGWWTIRAMTRATHAPLPPEWQARVRRLQRALGIARQVAVQVSNDVFVPCAARVLRPVIWLPAALLARMPAEQLEALFAHELAHIARRDWLWNGLQCVIEALLFFHPAAWWLGRRIRREREHACDDLAVAACGDAIALAEALTALERRRPPSPRLLLAANGGTLMQRISRLLSAPPTRGSWAARLGLGLVLTGGMLVAAQAAMSTQANAPLSVPRSDDREPAAHSVGVAMDGDRYYRATLNERGERVETYEVHGKPAPIDADARRWIAEARLQSAHAPGDVSAVPPAPPAPPAVPALPALPALPSLPSLSALRAVVSPEAPVAPPAPPAPLAPPVPPAPPPMTASKAFKALMALVAARPDVQARIGTPISVADDAFSGHIELGDGNGDAELNFRLRGPKGETQAHLRAELARELWRLDAFDMR